jgi:uncharacterized protein with FMN-binding domain
VADSGSNKKVANSVVALGSAAVLAVYAAGYLRTRSAADRFAAQAAERRPATPLPPVGATPAVVDAGAALASAAPVPPLPVTTPRPATPKRVAPRRKIAVPPASAPETASLTTASPSSAPALPVSPEPAPPVAAAPLPAEPAPAPAATAKIRYKDGTYTGWGTSRHGDIQASVVIENGRIASATIAQCLTRYSCSWIAALPPQVAARQSPEVDYVSGATQSTDAFYYAVVDALAKAK